MNLLVGTLLKRTIIWVNAETYARFVELLDAPPRSNAGLRKLLQQKAPWEQNIHDP